MDNKSKGNQKWQQFYYGNCSVCGYSGMNGAVAYHVHNCQRELDKKEREKYSAGSKEKQ